MEAVPHHNVPDTGAMIRALAPDEGRGDAADQAERLSMIMEAEAIAGARRGEPGEGSLLGMDYPLEDIESVLAMEDADDASNDPFHAGGLEPDPWVAAEVSAMHVIDDEASDLEELSDMEEWSG